MNTFEIFNLSKQLQNAIDELGFDIPTPIQKEAYSIILSGKDVVGIAQTGTGKTFAYMLPILQEFKFSKQVNPRVLILVPTRELVLQMVDMIEEFAKYINVRVLGVYGGTNVDGTTIEIDYAMIVPVSEIENLQKRVLVNNNQKLSVIPK